MCLSSSKQCAREALLFPVTDEETEPQLIMGPESIASGLAGVPSLTALCIPPKSEQTVEDDVFPRPRTAHQ